MFLRHLFRVSKNCLAWAVFSLALSLAGHCQNRSDAQENQAAKDSIDEITVYGAMSIRRLRMETYRAEENVFAVFNSLNSDDDFDVRCYREAPTGSHIKRRVCRANFVAKATAAETRGMILGIGYVPAIVRIRQKNKLLLKEMAALVVEHPELSEALGELADANQALAAERKRMCEGQNVFCQR